MAIAIGGTLLICNLQRGNLGTGHGGGIGGYDYKITYSLYRREGPDGKMSVSQTLSYHVEDSDNESFSGDFTFSGDDIRSQTSELVQVQESSCAKGREAARMRA